MSDSAKLKAWREEGARIIEESKQRMAKECGVERNAKFDIAWRIAWDYGHGSGISEVENYFRELSDLLKP